MSTPTAAREDLPNAALPRTPEQIERDCDRDNFMSSAEARDYGLVDTVLLKLPAAT